MTKETNSNANRRRSWSQVMCEIGRIVNQGRVKGVIGYAIRWETSAGSDMQMQWGQLKSRGCRRRIEQCGALDKSRDEQLGAVTGYAPLKLERRAPGTRK